MYSVFIAGNEIISYIAHTPIHTIAPNSRVSFKIFLFYFSTNYSHDFAPTILQLSAKFL